MSDFNTKLADAEAALKEAADAHRALKDEAAWRKRKAGAIDARVIELLVDRGFVDSDDLLDAIEEAVRDVRASDA